MQKLKQCKSSKYHFLARHPVHTNYAKTSSPLGVSETAPSTIESSSLLFTFPCFHPVNSFMRTKEARLQTFLDNSSLWSAHRIRAILYQIVDAGMYYFGERDRVKCWYCNEGLQK